MIKIVVTPLPMIISKKTKEDSMSKFRRKSIVDNSIIFIYTNNFCFLNFALFTLYRTVWWVVDDGFAAISLVVLLRLRLLLCCDNSIE